MNLNESLTSYGKYLKMVFDFCMKKLENNDLKIPFNFAFEEDWFFVVLRKNECSFGGVSMNTLGCLGSVLVKNNTLFELMMEKTTEEILESFLLEKEPK